jgi:hypothetical protein
MKKIFIMIGLCLFSIKAYAEVSGEVKLIKGDLQPLVVSKPTEEIGANLTIFLIHKKYLAEYQNTDTVNYSKAIELSRIASSYTLTNSKGKFVFNENTDDYAIMIVYGTFKKTIVYKKFTKSDRFSVDLTTH